MSDLEVLLRLVVALVFAGIIGWERESLGKPAGLRTHVLVGVGAALSVAVADSVAERFVAYGDLLRFDPIRVMEAVLTGIGFLGAGTIILRRGSDRVSGLTTAASIWATAVVGLAVGTGRYILAGGATAILFVVLRGLMVVEQRFNASPHEESDGEESSR